MSSYVYYYVSLVGGTPIPFEGRREEVAKLEQERLDHSYQNRFTMVAALSGSRMTPSIQPSYRVGVTDIRAKS